MEKDFLNIGQLILTLVGFVFTGVQLWQIKRNRKKQFEQSRREKTVEMVVMYTKSVNNKTKSIEKIVSQFNDDQCQDLYSCVPFTVDDRCACQICQICPNKEKCDSLEAAGEDIKCRTGKNNSFLLQGEMLHIVRGSVIEYLNTLESVLLSWQLGMVDQKALEEQFIFLDKKRQKERALETFRMIAGGGKSYPAIEKFYQYLDQKNRDEAQKSLRDILK